MNDKKLKDISKKMRRNILLVLGISLFVLIELMVLSTYSLKTELADQVGRTLEGKIKREDKREIVNILSDLKENNFRAVDLYDRNGKLQLTFPTQFRRQVSPAVKIWRSLTQATYEKPIYYDLKKNEIAATVVFTFGIFQLLPMTLLIFSIAALVTYPLVRNHKALLLESFKNEAIKAQTESITELARQVRHDYKSPLTAINSVIEKSTNIDEAERKTLSVAYNKMITMLRDLSQENIQDVLKNGIKKKKAKALTHVYSTILNTVEEKRARLGYNSKKKIQFKCNIEDKRAYILIDDTELERVISNLVENAIEAIDDEGIIIIHLHTVGTILKIEIQDSGKGIPKNQLQKIGTKGFSFNKKNGEGLGLYSAIQKANRWGGEIAVNSVENTRTTVEIKLPGAVKPKWACSEINYKNINQVVILDDDESIHEIWTEKLKSKTKAPIYKFTHAQELAKNLTKFKENTLFLLDYELRGQTETGLDVAEKLANHQNCHLVSNSFQDPKVQRECKRLEVKLFPKSLLGV